MFKNTTKTQRIIMAVTAVGAGIFMMYCAYTGHANIKDCFGKCYGETHSI